MADPLGPVEPEVFDQLNKLAQKLDFYLNGANKPEGDKEWGFIFAMFRFDDPHARFNYISNAGKSNRGEIVKILRELADQLSRKLH